MGKWRKLRGRRRESGGGGGGANTGHEMCLLIFTVLSQNFTVLEKIQRHKITKVTTVLTLP
jgi:hypothetical protein